MDDDRLAKLEGKVDKLEAKVDGLEGKLEAKIEAAKSSVVQWMVGITLGGVAIVVSVIMGFGSVLTRYVQDAKPVATQPPPIIINIPPSGQAQSSATAQGELTTKPAPTK